MIRSQVHLPHALRRTKALVEVGLPHDRPDPQGLSPVQVAGWEGIPDVMAYLLSLGVNLDHVNGYGGTAVDDNPWFGERAWRAQA